MSNDIIKQNPTDLVAGGTDLSPYDFTPLSGKGKAVVIVNAAIRFIAPAVDIAVQCETAEAERQQQWEDRAMNRAALPALSPAEQWELHLPLTADAYTAALQLRPIFCPDEYGGEVITSEWASVVLPVLAGATSKKRDENTSTWLSSVIGMFDPTVDSVGAALGLWKSVPRHPVMLALAIAQLSRTQKFFPAQAELLTAMQLVEKKLGWKYNHLMKQLRTFDDEDRTLFVLDREQWQKLYQASPEMIETTLQHCKFVERSLDGEPMKIKRNIELLKLQRPKDYVERFICSNCNVGFDDYKGQCDACFKWNTLVHPTKLLE